MFWGLIMEPNKRYTQTVEKSFHVSMASLDAATADNAIVQVMLCYDERNYLLCSLKKDLDWQVPLDLNFQEGTKIAFTSNGRGHVHLTGYLIPEEEDDLDLDALEEEEEEEEEEEDDEVVPQLVGKQPKRKANDTAKDDKKVKRLKVVVKQDESSEDEDDEEEEEEEIGAEVEDDSDEDDDEEEEDSDEEEEEPVEVKPQQKKNKQKEQQQQKVNAKQEKQKLVNGKDATAEPTKKETKKNKAEQQQQQQQNNAQQAQKKRVVEGGVQVEDLKTGTGRPAKSGKNISVYYVGRLKSGKQFDSTTQGDGFKFRLGKGEVIKGWDVGIAGMKVGGKRRITIPPHFAYGAKGSPPTIPGNSTLIFEVELKNVH